MNSVLNRKMFNMGGAAATGLDAFKGKALQPKSMPMTGIMGYADGGPVYLAEGGDPIQQRQMQNIGIMNQTLESLNPRARETAIANLAQIDKLRNEAVRLKQQGGVPESVIQDLNDQADSLEGQTRMFMSPYFKAREGLDPANMVASNLEDMDAGFLGIGKPSVGEIASLRDENQAILNQLATFDDETSQKYLTDLEEANPEVKSQVAEAKKTADIIDKADNPFTALRPAADGKATGDPDEDAEGIDKHLDKVAQESGRTDLTREDYSIKNNPYGAIGLLLAAKGMATAKTGSTVGDIVSGVSDAAVGMESLQRKDLELAADLEKERIAAQRRGATSANIQDYEYLAPDLMRMFPQASKQSIFRFTSSSAALDPLKQVKDLTEGIAKQEGQMDLSVAANYANLEVWDRIGSSLTNNMQPFVAVQDGTPISRNTALRLANDRLTEDDNVKTMSDALKAEGITAVKTIEELSALNMPKKAK